MLGEDVATAAAETAGDNGNTPSVPAGGESAAPATGKDLAAAAAAATVAAAEEDDDFEKAKQEVRVEAHECNVERKKNVVSDTCQVGNRPLKGLQDFM